MKTWIIRLALALATGGLVLVAAAWLISSGVGGTLQGGEELTRASVPADAVARRARSVESAADALSPPDAPTKQILFGDLHVHTTYSSDAYFFSLPMIQGEGVHPPADACDFARFCSELDFFSINDHAELIGQRQWRETRESIRRCNEVAGNPEQPDLVAFLGWEWTDMSPTEPGEHYGHKNVVVLGTSDAETPARPIGARSTALDQLFTKLGVVGGSLIAWPDFPDIQPYLDFNRYRRDVIAHETCPAGVHVRDLPPDCLEVAVEPEVLFEKLDQWDLPTLVIPHGTSWGIHAPPNASLATQLAGRQHDPNRQRLFEVYSGHGSSEQYRSWRHVEVDEQGRSICPERADGFTPCCWRAAELIRQRCGDVDQAVCDERARRASDYFIAAGLDPRRFSVVPDATPEDWLGCGTPPDGFLDAYIFRPRMSAQYGLALGNFAEPGDPKRFRYGLIASSDNHKARAGSGYKEFARKAMGDSWGFRDDVIAAFPAKMGDPAEPVPHDSVPVGKLFQPERGASFYYTGGLVAVHSEGRSRTAIWKGLTEREVYATSGDRMLLWFDLLNGPEGKVPMGGEASLDRSPRFQVRAVGAYVQRPGCPEYTRALLSPERLDRLCLGECYNPGDERKRITRIEVVRIRPQLHADEPVEPLIEDPWRVLSCPADPSGCRVEFEDPEFPESKRDAVYYVRAIQEPTPAVGGDPLRCERDAQGNCVKTRPCYASGPQFDPSDDCLAPVEERAWASPIFLTAKSESAD